jgi:hypothetical protein
MNIEIYNQMQMNLYVGRRCILLLGIDVAFISCLCTCNKPRACPGSCITLVLLALFQVIYTLLWKPIRNDETFFKRRCQQVVKGCMKEKVVSTKGSSWTRASAQPTTTGRTWSGTGELCLMNGFSDWGWARPYRAEAGWIEEPWTVQGWGFMKNKSLYEWV